METSCSETGRRDFQIEQWLKHVHTALPVKVLKVYPQEPGDVCCDKVGFVDVEPMLAQMDNDGQRVETHPFYNLPYVRIHGGTCAVVVDPQPGDFGLAVFCERDISLFKRNLCKCMPESNRLLSQSDGIYIGGILNKPPKIYVHLHPEKGVIIETDQANMTLNCGRDCRVTIKGKQTVNCDLTDHSGNIIIDGISFVDHVHGDVMPGGSTTGAPLK